LASLDLDLLVLGDCRILRPHVFEVPRYGTINVHPGYLPIVRGNTPYIWALLYDLPQGCSVHFLDKGVDSGPVIDRVKLDLSSIHDYKDLLKQINKLCAVLIVDALTVFVKTCTIKAVDQQELLEIGQKINTFRLAPSDVRSLAVAKIALINE
jgi:methionyl-tRNA formyltransferase